MHKSYNIYTKDINSLIAELFLPKEIKKSKIIFAINSKKMMLCEENTEHKAILKTADFLIPDGQGVVWMLKRKGVQIKKIAGIDLMIKICKKAAETNKKIFMYGASEESNEKTKAFLEKKFGGITIVGRCNGFIKDNDKIIDSINNSDADILFVALGSMAQEKWIIENRGKLASVKIIQGVGGSFDVLSGKYRRAPKYFLDHGIEWAYRMIQSPKRLPDLIQLFKFIIYVYKQ